MKTNKYLGAPQGLVVFLAGLLILSCTGQNDRDVPEGRKTLGQVLVSENEPVIVFDTLSHDFGTILEGEQVICIFGYENKGGSDLLLTGVHASCGCTVPEWSRAPLKPGAKSRIQVIFDSSGRSGLQHKILRVFSNAGVEPIRLEIRAKIN